MALFRNRLASLLIRAAQRIDGKQQITIPAGARPVSTEQVQQAMNTALNHMQQQENANNVAMGPGLPLQPSTGFVSPTGPRQFQYPAAYNAASLPGSGKLTSFGQLRALAASYEGIGLCERVWFDIVQRLVPHVTLDPNVMPDGESESDPKWQKIIRPAYEWIMTPDRNQPLAEWMTASVRDVLQVGYSTIYKQRNRLGDIVALELIDPVTMKPLIDDRGRTLPPPDPAWQQYLYGAPAGMYTTDDIAVVREMGRSESVYPVSRVEMIVLRINLALRKGELDLTRFTSGAIPEGLLFLNPDSNWTPEQIIEFESMLNSMLAGNDQAKVQMKVLPSGPQNFIASRTPDPNLALDTFLLNITVAAYGLTMDEISMTQNSNRSVGESQEAILYRRIMQPLANTYARLFTPIIKQRFDPRLRLEWEGFEESQDVLTKAQALEIGVKNGALSPSRMARMMNWPVDLEVPPMLLTKDGPIWLEDAINLRQAQKDAGQSNEFSMGAPGNAQNTPAPATAPSAPTSTEQTRADWKRWYAVAVKAMKNGQPQPVFRSDTIPAAEYHLVADELAVCETADEVRGVFRRAQQREQRRLLPIRKADIDEHRSVYPGFAAQQQLQHEAEALFHRIEEQALHSSP